MKRNEEHNAQAALFQWAFLECRRMPELALLFAVPNGGNRNARTGAMMKREGVRKGIPDIFLLCPRGKYHGMVLEMKSSTGSVKPEQKWWHQRFAEQGYHVTVCYSFEQAREEIENYLAQPKAKLC